MKILVIATLLIIAAISGCTGNYKYSDDNYRPLGDPAVTNPSA